MADNQGIFAVIGSSLGQLTLNIGVVGNLCNDDDRTRRLARQLMELHDRIATEERMLRMRFEMPEMQRPRTIDVNEVIGHRVTSAQRPAEIHKRLRTSQELCRTLEEYFRFFNLPNISRFYHKLRLDLYGFERLLVGIFGPVEPPRIDEELGPVEAMPLSNAADALSRCPLYFILDESLCRNRDPLRLGYDVVNAGVRLMQLRFKKLSTRDLLDLARRLKRLCGESNCRLIINDRADIALLSGADGIHIGATDLRVAEARQLGHNLLIGATVRSAQEALAAQADGADYVGTGAVFDSATKPEVPVIGLAGLRSTARKLDIPVVGIGGITLDNCARVMAAGAAGFCSIQPFASRRSAKNLVREFRKESREGLALSTGTKS